MSNYTIINVKIDVTKIDKDRLFRGERGTYLDATILVAPDADQYGNFGFIVQDPSKEEREADAKAKGTPIGNVRRVSLPKSAAQPKPAPKPPQQDEDDSGLPF